MAGSTSGNLDEGERQEAAGLKPPRALVIHEVVREEGEADLGRTAGSLAWSGLAAGLSMGFSFLALALIHAALPPAPWRVLVDSGGYTLGFLIVILGRQQLFTETTVSAILPPLTRRDRGTFGKAMRLWAIVLAANLAGTVAFAAILAGAGPFPGAVFAALAETAHEAVGGAFWPVLVRAIFAGWLIALMVWLLPGAGPSRPLLIILLTYVVALGRLSHVVAGSTEAAFAFFIGEAGVADYLLRFLLPSLIGNIVGGVSLVTLLNHAAVAPELATAGKG